MANTTSFLTVNNNSPYRSEKSDHHITRREREVLHLIIHEHSSKEIANKLFISYETANSHRKNIMNKLDVKNTAGMVRVAFEKGLIRIGQATFIFCFIFLTQSSAQISNDESVNYQSRATIFNFGTSNDQDEQSGLNKPTFLIKSEKNSDGENKELMKYGFNKNHGEDECIHWKEDIPASLTLSYTLHTVINTTNSEFDFHYIAYDKNFLVDKRCEMRDIGFKDYHTAHVYGHRNARTGTPNSWQKLRTAKMISNASEVHMDGIWRFVNGDTPGTALDFGILESGDTKFHSNSNRSAPIHADASMGYTNQLYQNNDFYHIGNDVMYKFKITDKNKKVTITTNHSATNFDTKLILTTLDSFGVPIVYNDDSDGGLKSTIVADLGPEEYLIIVKGVINTTEGDFGLVVSAEDASVKPGGISIIGDSLCQDEQYGIVDNLTPVSTGTTRSAATPYKTTSYWNYKTGAVTYQWEIAVGTDGYSDIAGGTNSVLGSSPNRTMPNLNSSSDKTVRFRRIGIVGGNTAPTDSVRFTFRPSSIEPGTIVYHDINNQLKDPIPAQREGYSNDGALMNAISAIGMPSPVLYQYQYSTDDFASEHTTSSFNSNEGSAMTSFGIFNQTTKIRRAAKNGCDVTVYSNVLTVPAIKADGLIRGSITSLPVNGQQGVGIQGVEVCAIPIDPINGVETECAITDNDGKYSIDSLYYGDQAVEFKVFPILASHKIRNDASSQDSSRNETINTSQQTRTIDNVDFVDLTPYSLSGNVFQQFQSSNYGKQGVIIRRNGIAVDTTDENGNYGLIIPSAGTWTITPEFIDPSGLSTPSRKHTFSPESQEILVNASQTDIDFENTSKQRLLIEVVGNCNETSTYLGTVTLKIKDKEKDNGATNSINLDLRTSANTGIFNELLPAREYTVDIVAEDTNLSDRPEPYPYSEITNVQTQLEAYPDIKVNILWEGVTTVVLYHPPIDLVLDESAFDTISACSNTSLAGLKLMETGVLNPKFKLTVFEGPAINGCLLDTGYVDIDDVIGDNAGTLPISKGQVMNSMGRPYRLMAGNPNIGGDHLKTSTYTASTLNNSSQEVETLTVIVEGDKARDKTFVTITPEVPLLILHDPPTDRGYSFVEENTEFDIGIKTYTKEGKDYGAWLTGKLGFESTTEVGIGVSIGTGNKVWGSLTGTITGEQTDTYIDQTNLSFSTTQRYQTSETLIGEDGDVFIGAAFNMIYANTDKIIVDTAACEIINDVGLIIEPNDISTTYIYNTIGIQTQIAKLENIKEIFPDSAKYYDIQINQWRKTLVDNKKYKQSLIKVGKKGSLINNYSFNGQNMFERKVKYDTTYISTHEFNVELDLGVATELGFELAGSGVSGGAFINFKMETITTNDTTETNSFESGFLLFDDDPNDVFSVDIYKDARYNTPFFNTVASATSCPWEGAPDEPEELPLEKVDDFTVQLKTGFPSSIVNVPPNQPAEFKFIISNISPTFTSSYRVRVDPRYNQDNAIIQLSGFAPGLTGRYQNVLPGESIEIGVLVNHPGTQTFSFNDLSIIFESECSFEADMYGDEVTREVRAISVNFLSECSSIRIAAPTTNRIINISDENELQIIMKDYTKSKIDNVTLQFTKKGRGNWINSNIFLIQDELNNDAIVDGTGTFWNLDEILEDGTYELRLKVDCGISINYSQLIEIIIDREKPQVFGLPYPIDDRYDFDLNDIIAVAFHELIDCNTATALIIDIISGDTLPMILNPLECFENTVDIVPPSFIGRSPSVYRVVLSGIEDVHGNMADEYRWVFAVGDFHFEEAACLPELSISNNNLDQNAISVSAYRALRIITDGIIPDFGETSLTAQEDIIFNPGFSVNTGGDLVAKIEDCDAPIACETVLSPVGVTEAPEDTLRWEIVENQTCIENVALEENPRTIDVIVSVNDFVTPGDNSQIDVSLSMTLPFGEGVINESMILQADSQYVTTEMGIYKAINGSSFKVRIKTKYDNSEIAGGDNLVSAFVKMIPVVIP